VSGSRPLDFVDGSGATLMKFLTTNGYLGIGTTAPAYKLDVAGDIRATGNIFGANFYGNVQPGYTAGGWIEDSGNNRVYTSNANYNVGIATTAPSSFKLQVAGDIGPQTHNTYNLGASTMRWHHLYLAGGSLHMGDNGNEGIIGYDTTTNAIGLDPDGAGTSALVVKRTSGNVGIGTTNPIEKLVVTDAGKKSFELRPGNDYVSFIVNGVEVARMRQ
jgi:hypothetical protein